MPMVFGFGQNYNSNTGTSNIVFIGEGIVYISWKR